MTVELAYEASQTEVIRIRNDLVSANTYVVRSNVVEPAGVRSVCLVIDPGSSLETLQHVLRSVDVVPTTLLTHGHFDHVFGAHQMSQLGSPVYMSGADSVHLRRNNFYLRTLSFQQRVTDFDFADLRAERPEVPGLEVVWAPGHSEGSCAFVFNGLVFTGDTILSREVFSQTVAGSNAQSHKRSATRLVTKCAESHLTCPGHGKPSTFAQLMDRNADFAVIVNTLQGHQ